ncbi:MAG: NAD(P)-binding protein [Gammaproteobacteria bacterium]|nr:NAD(P)-binding protein [Gammaproteobacteria bacterium]
MTERRRLDITRRDFLQGIALTTAGGALLSPWQAAARGVVPFEVPGMSEYPPAKTGMRGSHVGSFEVGHGISWEGKRWPVPERQTDATYDLVVVGGGPSGLSAAWFYREAKPDARILIIDNHDDFGGHCKRNEMIVDGQLLLANGGSQTLPTPSHLPPHTQRLWDQIGIEAARFDEYFDRRFFETHHKPGMFFSKANYGKAKLTGSPTSSLHYYMGYKTPVDRVLINSFPLSTESKAGLIDLYTSERTEVFDGMDAEAAMQALMTMSYADYLRGEWGLTPEAVSIFHGSDALDVEALPMFMAYYSGFPVPGLDHMLREMGMGPIDMMEYTEGYYHQYPDGLASLARLLVVDLIPGVVRESLAEPKQESILYARLDYSRLDRPDNPVRIRLNSTGVDVRHSADRRFVDVVHVTGGTPHRVRAKHCVLACWHQIIPHIHRELDDKQRVALSLMEKTPMMFANLALRNWRPMAKAGYGVIDVPGEVFSNFTLQLPMAIGEHPAPTDPDKPIWIQGTFMRSQYAKGLPIREQFRLGRYQIYNTSFDEYEHHLLRQMTDIWGPYGFDAERDVAAITINRWPHGWIYQYNSLYDDPTWEPEGPVGPHVDARKQVHRISIANSDAAAAMHTAGAMDQAHRAVREQLALG